MAAPTYTLATVTKNPDGTLTLGNKPASAYATATQNMGGDKVPLPIANLSAPTTPGGPTYTAGAGIDITGNVISAPGLPSKADLVGGTVPLAQLPAQLGPLSYPVMASTRTLGYLGYASLEAASASVPYRPLVLNVPRLNIVQTMTLTAELHAQGTQLLVEDGATLQLDAGACLYKANVLNQGGGNATGVVQLVNTQGGTPLTSLWDSLFTLPVLFTAGTALTLRGNSRLAVVPQGTGTIYLYDQADVTLPLPAGITLVDKRPGAAGGSTYQPPLTDFSSYALNGANQRVVTFRRSANLPTVSTGTVALDPSGASKDVVVFLWFGPSATLPDLSDPAFQREPGARYVAGKTHRLALMSGGNDLIQYNLTAF